MAILQSLLQYDNSTFANYKQWASGVSAALAASGWTQTTDTGQVSWTSSIVNITAVAVSGGNGVYTYTLTSGPVLRVGMSIVITGLVNGGNNVTATITALGAGTFTIVNATAVVESGSSGTGTVAAVTTVPGSNVIRDVEVWKWTDSLAAACPVFMKFEYGSNTNATLCPQFRVTIGTGSNGSGGITGNQTGGVAFTTAAIAQGASTFECNFSSRPGSFALMMWRTHPTTAQQFFAIERSLDSNGNCTSTYFTVVMAGATGSGSGCNQWTLMAQGTGGQWSVNANGNGLTTSGGIATIGLPNIQNNTTQFGSNTAFLPIFPMLGKIDNPLTIVGAVKSGDQSEGALFTIQLYGQTRSYLYSKVSNFNNFASGSGTSNGVAMRWD